MDKVDEVQNNNAFDWLMETDPKSEIAHVRMGHFLEENPSMCFTVAREMPEFRLECIAQNWRSLECFPGREVTKEQAMVALSQNVQALKLLPKSLLKRNPELLEMAVKREASALVYIPEDLLTADLCRLAIASDPCLIRITPSDFIDEADALAAVTMDGSLLKYVPCDLLTSVICKTAVANYPLALEYVPYEMRSSQMENEAVTKDWRCIKHVRRRTKKLLLIAFSQSVNALEYFPKSKKTREICEQAFERDVSSIRFFPTELLDMDKLAIWIDQQPAWVPGRYILRPSEDSVLVKLLSHIDDQILAAPKYRASLRRAGIRRVVSAKWQADQSTFLVEEEISPLRGVGWNTRCIHINAEVNTVEELTELLDGDLSSVDFGDYQFDCMDPKDNVPSTPDTISTATPEPYDDHDYLTLIGSGIPALALRPSSTSKAKGSIEQIEHIGAESFSKPEKILYISDLHLDHKLANRFPNGARRVEIEDWLDKFIDSITDGARISFLNKILIILGDTSYNMELSRLFLTKLQAKLCISHVICIPGNHEIWDYSGTIGLSRPPITLDEVLSKYHQMLIDSHVYMLQNGLFVFSPFEGWHLFEQEQISKMPDSELTALLTNSHLTILGGTGFTGYCADFNATHGLYRDVITTLEEDVILSDRFSALHERVRRLAPHANVVVATHTPMRCWSQEQFQQGWIYLSGHTHVNTSYEACGARIYENGQVGYEETNVTLQCIYAEGRFNPYRELTDGIYEIDAFEYAAFCSNATMRSKPMKSSGQVLLLKKEGIYLFLLLRKDGQLRLLDGKKPRVLDNNDPEYYYQYMVPYAAALKREFGNYQDTLECISKEIQKMGGIGTVHGTIVDVDFFNHVSLDPHTGKLIYYHATDTSHKVTYQTMKDLLEDHAQHLLPGYEALSHTGVEDNLTPVVSISSTDWTSTGYDYGLYRSSNKMRAIQYLLVENVIRIWNDDVLRTHFIKTLPK